MGASKGCDRGGERARARVALRERQLAPLDVGALGGAGTGKARRAHLGVADLTLLSRQWATLLAAGLTVEHTLAALIEQSEREPVRRLLAGVRSEIVAGYSLSAALERFPNAFPTLYRASVAAGEHSGELPRVMLQLADHLEQGDALRRKTLQALIYPALVACVALAIVTALMVWVVPQVVGVFSQSRQSLPALTELMIALSAFIRNWGGAVLLVIGGLGLSFARALRQHTFRLGVDRLLLRLPCWGATCARWTPPASPVRWPSSWAAASPCWQHSKPAPASCNACRCATRCVRPARKCARVSACHARWPRAAAFRPCCCT